MQFNTTVLNVNQDSKCSLKQPAFCSPQVSFVLKAGSLMLTKMVYHTHQRKTMSICSRITGRSLGIHSDSSFQKQVAKEIKSTDSLSFRTLPQEQDTRPLFANPPYLYSFILARYFSPTPPSFPSKKTLCSLNLDKGVPLSSNSNISSVPGVLYRLLKIQVFENRTRKFSLCLCFPPAYPFSMTSLT